MVWCYCSICGESEKVEETRELLLSTSQSFNLSISSAEDLTHHF
ncbi:9120_t:CDS:2 [Dentiscutata erythropus]|uniref:9120_t:CDS:1 n=1 Tax=Dentiscutata erythropus TaxID=1348616 RepID=A0A9N9EE84_9GLOM|nr:9120_t:CDS:2 [Dentiscutata erythropus]